MTNKLSGESSPVRMVLGFVLGLVVILSAVAVLIMDRKVSGLEERLGAIVGRLDAIDGRQDAIDGRQDAIERRLPETSQGENP